MDETSGEVWHRFEDFCTAPPLNEWDEPCGDPGVQLRHRTFEVVKTTKHGVWLREIIPPFDGETRFVLSGARKRFACPTEEEALASFRSRKHCQIAILQANIRLAQRALALAPPDAG
jgi:hypothetical protein